MINGSYLGGMAEVNIPGEAECRPDPEKMLQRARASIELCDKAEAMLMELAEMRVEISFGRNSVEAFSCAVGSIRLCRHRHQRDEAMWLAEIDKG